MGEPLVSVIVPVYNAARWLAETVQSALAQTWPNLEVILVDDGSRDESLALAHSLASSRVKVIAQENSGASQARQTGLEAAQGDFIQYLDADDLLSPDKIAVQISVCRESAPDTLPLSPCAHFYDGENPRAASVEEGWPIVDSDDPAQWFIEMLGGGERNAAPVLIHSWLAPRSLSDRIGPWDTVRSPCDDGEYFARLVLHSRGVRRAGGCGYYRRFREQISWGGATTRAADAGRLHSWELIASHLLACTDGPRARTALARQFASLAYSAYPQHPEITETALQHIAKLGVRITPQAGGRMDVIGAILGWKAARRIGLKYKQWRAGRVVSRA